MIINLNDSWPEALDGTRTPLPKQAELIEKALDMSPQAPKYIRYIGGVGSGKSVSGCMCVLSWAVMYGGDYVICRQFGTDLKDTTYKTFLEICPPELIAEHRVAERTIRIKNAQGTISNVFMRGLDDPDKLRSLNLNGAYVDEANQTTEEAFALLQGRLRGKHVRKIVLTTNSSGRNWLWKYFVDKSCFKNDWVKNQFYNIHAPSTENVHLPEGYVESMLQGWSDDRIKREVFADEDSFAGQVYSEFNRNLHVVKPFRIPDHWDRHIRIDHGYRNPAAIGFFAISPEGEVYLYKEIYEKEWLIHELINGKVINGEAQRGILANIGEDRFISAKIDPSTRNRHGSTGTSDFDEYYRVWPKKLPILGPAMNDVQVGIDRVKSYLKVNPKTGRPLLFFFEDCKNTLEEIGTYKYPELKDGQAEVRAEHEKPVKAKDHAMDMLRYMIVDLPDPTKVNEIKQKFKHACLEKSLMKELSSIANPPTKDPFRDFD